MCMGSVCNVVIVTVKCRKKLVSWLDCFCIITLLLYYLNS